MPERNVVIHGLKNTQLSAKRIIRKCRNTGNKPAIASCYLLLCVVMQIQEAIRFIHHKVLSAASPVRWADLGCGSGTFTAALAHYLPAGSTIYAVDRVIPYNSKIEVPAGVQVEMIQADFVEEALPFAALDGVIMANALHYVKDQPAFLEKLKTVLQVNSSILIVEYDTDTPVPVWVPYPLSYISLERLFQQHGFSHVSKMRERQSVYGRANLYTALISR